MTAITWQFKMTLLFALAVAVMAVPGIGGVYPAGWTDLYPFENLEEGQSIAIVTVAEVHESSSSVRHTQTSPPGREHMRLEMHIDELLAGHLGPNDIVLTMAPVVPCGEEWCYVATEGRYALQRGDRALLIVQKMTGRDGFRFGEHFVRFERFLEAGALSDTMVLCKKRNWVEWASLGGNSTSSSFHDVMEAMRCELRPTAYRLGDVRRVLPARREDR